METTNFLAWIIVIGAIAAFALVSMLWAYQGSGSVAIIFKEAIAPALIPTEVEAAIAAFEQGVEAFRAGQYSTALEAFTTAIQQDENLTEAYHNRGLTFANLRQDNEAAANLLKAGDLYLQQGNRESFDLVKQHLEMLKNRK